MELIDEKAEGQQIISELAAPAGRYIDLMAALEASMKAIKENELRTKKSKKQKPA